MIFTPKPEKTPEPSRGPGPGWPGDCGHGNPHECTPAPTVIEEQRAGTAGTLPPADLGILVPATALSLVAWLVPIGARLRPTSLRR